MLHAMEELQKSHVIRIDINIYNKLKEYAKMEKKSIKAIADEILMDHIEIMEAWEKI